jgi:hypothetical protein
MSTEFRMTVFSGVLTQAETVAFGYLARALVFEQRVRRTFGYPRHAPFR